MPSIAKVGGVSRRLHHAQRPCEFRESQTLPNPKPASLNPISRNPNCHFRLAGSITLSHSEPAETLPLSSILSPEVVSRKCYDERVRGDRGPVLHFHASTLRSYAWLPSVGSGSGSTVSEARVVATGNDRSGGGGNFSGFRAGGGRVHVQLPWPLLQQQRQNQE